MAREARTVIITHGSYTIRAGFGIADTLKQPTVEVRARVGLRQSQIQLLSEYHASQQQQSKADAVEGSDDPSSATAASDASHPLRPHDYLVGHLLDEAIRNQEDDDSDPVSVFWPMVNGEIKDWDGMRALWYYIIFFTLPVVRSTNSSVTLLSLPPQAITRRSSAEIHRIFFEDLNVPAFCLVDSATSSSFAVGQMGACVIDVGWRGSSVACVSDAMVVPSATRSAPVGLGECIGYLASQLAQDANLVQSLRALEAEAASSSSSTPPTTIESFLQLAETLFNDGLVTLDVVEGGDLAQETEDDGNFDILGALTSGKEQEAIEAQQKKNKALIEQGQEPEPMPSLTVPENPGSGAQTPSANTIEIVYKRTPLRIPKAPLARAAFPFIEPSMLSAVDPAFLELPTIPTTTRGASSPSAIEEPNWSAAASLPEVIWNCINSVADVGLRNPLWQLLVVTGLPTRVLKGLTPFIVSACSKYISASAASQQGGAGGVGGFDDASGGIGFQSLAQPANVRALKTPDYFVEYKERTDLAPFLGASIYAKLVFADTQARGYTLKSGYIEKGPSVAFTVAAS